jgi:hypothetical protein
VGGRDLCLGEKRYGLDWGKGEGHEDKSFMSDFRFRRRQRRKLFLQPR